MSSTFLDMKKQFNFDQLVAKSNEQQMLDDKYGDRGYHEFQRNFTSLRDSKNEELRHYKAEANELRTLVESQRQAQRTLSKKLLTASPSPSFLKSSYANHVNRNYYSEEASSYGSPVAINDSLEEKYYLSPLGSNGGDRGGRYNSGAERVAGKRSMMSSNSSPALLFDADEQDVSVNPAQPTSRASYARFGRQGRTVSDSVSERLALYDSDQGRRDYDQFTFKSPEKLVPMQHPDFYSPLQNRNQQQHQHQHQHLVPIVQSPSHLKEVGPNPIQGRALINKLGYYDQISRGKGKLGPEFLNNTMATSFISREAGAFIR